MICMCKCHASLWGTEWYYYLASMSVTVTRWHWYLLRQQKFIAKLSNIEQWFDRDRRTTLYRERRELSEVIYYPAYFFCDLLLGKSMGCLDPCGSQVGVHKGKGTGSHITHPLPIPIPMHRLYSGYSTGTLQSTLQSTPQRNKVELIYCGPESTMPGLQSVGNEIRVTFVWISKHVNHTKTWSIFILRPRQPPPWTQTSLLPNRSQRSPKRPEQILKNSVRVHGSGKTMVVR